MKWLISYEESIRKSNGKSVLDFEYISNHIECINEIKYYLYQNDNFRNRVITKLIEDENWRNKFLKYFPEYLINDNNSNFIRR